MSFRSLALVLLVSLSRPFAISAQDPQQLPRQKDITGNKATDSSKTVVSSSPGLANANCSEPGGNLPFPFGTEVGDIYTGPNDDGSSEAVTLNIPMKFLGQEYSVAYQNTNGQVSFVPVNNFYWLYLPTSRVPAMTAVYWADIYTFGDGECRNDLWFRYSEETSDLLIANSIIQAANAGFQSEAVLVATWYEVEPFAVVNVTSTFQLAMAWDSSGDSTWAIMAYDKLEFANAVNGFNDGLGEQGGLINVVSDNQDTEALLQGTNVAMPGIYVYEVSDTFASQVAPPTPVPCTEPEDATLPFPFGQSAGDSMTFVSEDGRYVQDNVNLDIPVLFLGVPYSQVYQSFSGVLTFDQVFGSNSWDYLPNQYYPAMSATYWTDFVGQAEDGCGADLWIRYSENADDIGLAESLIQRVGIGTGFTADAVVVATWYEVNRYGNFTGDGGHSFQSVLAWNTTETSQTWAIFAYSELSTASAASGFNGGSNGRGGLVNIINDENDAAALLSGSNIGMPGLYVYEVSRDFESSIEPPTASPTPAPTPCGEPPAVHLPFPFGDETADISTPPNDDQSSVAINLTIPVRFLGVEYSVAYQNTNGHVSFGAPAWVYFWQYLPSTTIETLVAIYWTDIFTGLDGACSNGLWVRYSENEDELAIASSLVSDTRRKTARNRKLEQSKQAGKGRIIKGNKSKYTVDRKLGSQRGKGRGKGRGKKSKGSKSHKSTSSSRSSSSSSSSSSKNGHDSTSIQFDAVLVATWYRVEMITELGTGQYATFQLAIAWNDDVTWVILAYDDLDYIGSSQRGSAIGFNSNEGLEGGLIGVVNSQDDIDVLLNGSNIGVDGIYAFEVSESLDADRILPVPDPTNIPTEAPSN